METIKRILTDLHPDIDFDTADALIDGGILDSFDIVTIVAEIDDAFGLQIPAEELIPENFNSARTLHALIRRLTEN